MVKKALPVGEALGLRPEIREHRRQQIEVGARSGRLMNVGLHPHVSGRAHRIRALREFIEHVKGTKGVWWPKREELAAWYLENHESHMPGQLK